MINKLYILFLFLSLFGCEKWNLEEINFLEINIKNIKPISITTLTITGEINGLQVEEVSDHGFVWTRQEAPPNILLNEKESLGIMSKEDSSSFSRSIENLLPSTRYVFAVYAQTIEGIILYSDTLHYNTGTGVVTTDSLKVIPCANNIELYGSFSGAQAGIIGVQHGFCWSTDEILPTLENEYSISGSLQTNESFQFTIEGLLEDVLFYFRAYAIINLPGTFDKDTLYGNSLYFDGDLDIWTQRADFAGGVRNSAVGFSIGNKGYIGTGTDMDSNKTKDFWEYDPISDQWTQKADFAGGIRISANGFSIGNKGYVGTGRGSMNDYMNDFWEYDPSLDEWIQKADFPGSHFRQNSTSFSIENKGYVGMGRDSMFDYRNDFWEYDPSTDQWAKKANFAGGPRWGEVGFSILNKGYIGTGVDTENNKKNDFWEYDPSADQWTQKANFAGGPRWIAVGFSIGNRGYIGMGSNLGFIKDFWEYDPSVDQWIQKADCIGNGRISAVGFSIGDKGYFGTGSDLIFNLTKDFWEY